MSKNLKGTRIRGLPPKVLLSRRQDASGSFPTVWRTASDNRTGNYNVFFNDTKVVPFNQKVIPEISISSATYSTPQYEEKIVAVIPKKTSINVLFVSPFTSIPIVVVGDFRSIDNQENINAYVLSVTTSGFTVNFSPSFKGSFVYRAVLPTTPPGQLCYVERTPRYHGVYTTLVAGQKTITADYGFSLIHDNFVPVKNYITYYDHLVNYQADIYPTSIVSTPTDITVGDSAFVPDSITANYIGVDDSRTTPPGSTVRLQGIVYPLVMTPQAISQSLSPQDKIDLYKQPYLDGSTIKNLPIITTGSMIRGVSDEFVTFTPGQEIKPFSDFFNPAVDGKKNVANPFYATGSIPITFGGPVWSKSKFEIFLTSSATKFGDNIVYTYKNDHTHYSGYFGPMMYWDTNQQNFVGLDDKHLQQDLNPSFPNLKKFLSRQHIGFGYSMDSNITFYDQDLVEKPKSYLARGNQISNFGFPYHEKFKPSSTQTISMQDYISEPFLLEKVVLYMSATLDFGVYSNGNVCTSSYGQWTFFILNERATFPQQSDGQTISASIDEASYSFVSSSNISTTIRDVVDFMRIAVVNNLLPTEPTIYQTRELTLTKSLADRYITGEFIISSSVKNANQFDEGVRSVWVLDIAETKQNALIEQNHHAGRDGLDINFRNGRNWLSVYDDRSTIGTAVYNFPNSHTPNTFTIKSSYQNTPNPYLLLPTDKLVFGWQMPLDMDQFVASSSMAFGRNAINKVVFYGSLMRLNEENMLAEHHDTLNQLLNSETIHEVIG
jgi:hypothetical protein